MRRHRSSVIGILNGSDRVRIRGTLRWLCDVDRFGKYLSAMKVRLKDFKPYAEGITDRVRRATERMAEEAGRPLRWKARRARALHPLSGEDATLLPAVNRGEFAVHGFRHRDLRALRYSRATSDPKQARRPSAAITRKLRLLRASGLIRKAPHTHRYTLSPKRRTILHA